MRGVGRGVGVLTERPAGAHRGGVGVGVVGYRAVRVGLHGGAEGSHEVGLASSLSAEILAGAAAGDSRPHHDFSPLKVK